MTRTQSRAFSVGILAAAAFFAATSAQAQSSVGLYGLLDVGAGQFQDAGGAKVKKVDSGNMSTSFFGVKGTEDLGGGTAANFTMEGFLKLDGGTSGRFNGDAFWARNAFVGLSSGAGSVNVGRNTTSLFVSTLLFNAFGDSFSFSPSIRHYFTSGAVSQASGDTGWNNSVSYTSPNMGGLTAQVQVAAAEGAGKRNVGGNVLYFSGPLAATLAYQDAEAGAGTPVTKTTQLGVSYNLGVAKLFGQFGKITNDTANVSHKLVDVGASIPVGSGAILAQYGQSTPGTVAGTDTKRKTLSVGYDHNLSKRTDLYAVYMNDKKDGATSGNTFAVGVRHRF